MDRWQLRVQFRKWLAGIRRRSGNLYDAKEVTAGLIRDTGFEPLDAGPLAMARNVEPFTLLVAQLAYEGEEGPALAYRFLHFDART